MRDPHALPIGDLLREFETDVRDGLSDDVARARLATHGRNELPPEKKPSVIVKFLKQFHNVLTYILLAAAAISVASGEAADAYAIGVAILVRVVIGFIQERRAESAIERLRRLVVQEASVIREGHVHRIDAALVVPGDLVLLEEGDRVTADARLVESRELQTNESALTGESQNVEKSVADLPAGTALADRRNMVWMGTTVVAGTARAVVVETGPRTAFGRIAVSLGEIRRDRTPLETRLDKLGRQLGLLAVVLSVAFFLLGSAKGFPLVEMFFFAVALMVSVVPEGLPAVLAIVMAIGVQRMAKRQAVIRHVPAVETLGAADIVCTDKTGTLTENKMTVREIVAGGHLLAVSGEGWETEGEFFVEGRKVRPAEIPEADHLLKAAAMCTRASLEVREERIAVIGDPTEGALVVLAAKAGIDKRDLEREYAVLDEVPFNSVRKFRAVLVEYTDLDGKKSRSAFVVGAFEVLRGRSSEAVIGGHGVPLAGLTREAFDAANARMAGRALRVLAVAMKRLPPERDALGEDDISGLSFLGLVGMMDPPRQGVAQAIERCRRAGVRVMMVTGDQKATAVAIGREIGLLPAGVPADGKVFTESEVAGLGEAEFLAALKGAVIFARVTPETKLRIVSGLKSMGHIVAMTGDGVNDAPALKKASIGVAMGITGTDVTKEVADMVLADDNFVSIVNAIEEGRIVFRNIKQTTAYLVMTNVGEVVTLLAGLAAGLPLPLLPAQILWMNLITDGFPDVALAAEPSSGDVLSEPPRKRNAPILSRNILLLTGITATLMCAGTLALFIWALGLGDLAHARSVAFTAMAVFQLWNVFNMRSASTSLVTMGLRSNPYVLGAVTLSLLLQIAVLYVPALQAVFKTAPLGWTEWMLIIVVTSSVFFAVEIYKFFIRRGIVPRSWQ